MCDLSTMQCGVSTCRPMILVPTRYEQSSPIRSEYLDETRTPMPQSQPISQSSTPVATAINEWSFNSNLIVMAAERVGRHAPPDQGNLPTLREKGPWLRTG